MNYQLIFPLGSLAYGQHINAGWRVVLISDGKAYLAMPERCHG